MQGSLSSSIEPRYRTFDGLLFESMHVCQLRRHHGLPDRYTRLRAEAHADRRRTGATSRRHSSNRLALVSAGTHCGNMLQ